MEALKYRGNWICKPLSACAGAKTWPTWIHDRLTVCWPGLAGRGCQDSKKLPIEAVTGNHVRTAFAQSWSVSNTHKTPACNSLLPPPTWLLQSESSASLLLVQWLHFLMLDHQHTKGPRASCAETSQGFPVRTACLCRKLCSLSWPGPRNMLHPRLKQLADEGPACSE